MITAIEAALKQCNGDVFANLGRQYLVYRFSHVYPTGFVLGKEKSKIGIPDNFIPVKDYYIYSEITTKADNVVSKLKSDIGHCFDQTDIPKNRILKIILICNSVIDASDYHDLKKHLLLYSDEIKLEVLSLKNFSNQIFRNYPSLARKLGLSIDTYQILETPEFIEEYQKSKFATTLSNKFFNRQQELSEVLGKLDHEDIILLTGPAGTGKTKFGIELIRIFINQNDDYNSKIIRANGMLDMWNDLQSFLVPEENYIILVDDANKLKLNLDYLINFKNQRLGKGKLKILLTIRNHLIKEIEYLLDRPTTVNFKPFTRAELNNILQSEDFNINDYGADRIWEISKGNPRLAIMAATAGINGDIEKLQNPAQILHEHFSSVRETFEQLNDQELQMVMGILALFRTIDFSNKEQIDEIAHFFKINEEKLQIHLATLYQNEIADHLGDVYKIGDQILGEYLIFLVFLKEKTIPFSKLLEIYFHKDARFGLGQIMVQQINNFNYQEIFDLVQTDIKEAWNNRGCDRIAVPFINDFYFFIPIEALAYVSAITDKEPQAVYNRFKFEVWKSNLINSYADRQIEFLLKYKILKKEHFGLSLDILFNYCIKSEQRFQKFLKACVQGFVMSKNSHYYGYSVQVELFSFLFEKLKEDEVFIGKIILFIAPNFLKDTFTSTTNHGKEIIIGTYAVILTDEQLTLRNRIWRFIFGSWENETLKPSVRKCILEYTQNLDYYEKNEFVILHDKTLLLDFFQKRANKNEFVDNILIEKYIGKLKWLRLKVGGRLLETLQNPAFKLYVNITDGSFSKKEVRMSVDKYERYLDNKFKALLKSWDFPNLASIYNHYDVILKNQLYVSDNLYKVKDSVCKLFIFLGNRDFDQFLKLYQKFSRSAYYTLIARDFFRKIRMGSEKIEKFRNVLIKKKLIYDLATLQLNISPRNLRRRDYEDFLDYFGSNRITHYWFITGLLKRFKKYHKGDEATISALINILLKKAKKYSITVPLDFFEYLSSDYQELFERELDTICELYLLLDKQSRHFDYSLKVLKTILQIEPNFINRLMQSHFDGQYHLSNSALLENDFSKLWVMERYSEIFTRILDYLNRFHSGSQSPSAVSKLFQSGNDLQLNFLKNYLNDQSGDKAILNVFSIIVSVFNEHRFMFLDYLLALGIDIDTFRRLDFVVMNMIYAGSIIPRYQKRIEELNKYKNHLESKRDSKLLPYISIVQDKIDYNHRNIQYSRKMEFLSTWGI